MTPHQHATMETIDPYDFLATKNPLPPVADQRKALLAMASPLKTKPAAMEFIQRGGLKIVMDLLSRPRPDADDSYLDSTEYNDQIHICIYGLQTIYDAFSMLGEVPDLLGRKDLYVIISFAECRVRILRQESLKLLEKLAKQISMANNSQLAKRCLLAILLNLENSDDKGTWPLAWRAMLSLCQHESIRALCSIAPAGTATEMEITQILIRIVYKFGRSDVEKWDVVVCALRWLQCFAKKETGHYILKQVLMDDMLERLRLFSLWSSIGTKQATFALISAFASQGNDFVQLIMGIGGKNKAYVQTKKTALQGKWQLKKYALRALISLYTQADEIRLQQIVRDRGIDALLRVLSNPNADVELLVEIITAIGTGLNSHVLNGDHRGRCKKALENVAFDCSTAEVFKAAERVLNRHFSSNDDDDEDTDENRFRMPVYQVPPKQLFEGDSTPSKRRKTSHGALGVLNGNN